MVDLNRRHKVGLFLAVVATGLSLVLEASARQTGGILVLGIAAAWLMGSLSPRSLGIIGWLLVCALGLLIALLPVKEDWDRYGRKSQQYDFAVLELQAAIAKSPLMIWEIEAKDQELGFVPEQFDGVVRHRTLGALQFESAMPHEERNRIIERMEARAKGQPINLPGRIVREMRNVEIPASAQAWEQPPETSDEWVTISIPFRGSESNEEIMRYFQTQLLLPRPTFPLRAALRANRRPVLLGLTLVAAGALGCGWLIRAALQTKRERAAK